MKPVDYLSPPTADDVVSLLEKKCREQLARITDTTGIWSHEGGLKEAYTDVLQTIGVYHDLNKH